MVRNLGILLALAALCSCVPATVLIKPHEPLSGAWGVAVYPVLFRFPTSSFESFTRGRQIADLVSDDTNCLVYGPGEFRVIDADDDQPRHGTTIGSAIRFSEQHMPPGLYALRTIVNRTIAQSAAGEITDDHGNVRAVRAADMIEHVRVRVELLSVNTGGIVAQLEERVSVNLLEDPSADPYPEITNVTRELVDDLVHVAGLPSNHKPSISGLKTMPVLKPALAYAATGGRSMSTELSHLDALDAEAKVLNLIKREDPSALRARQRLYEHEDTGLVVTDVDGAAKEAGLHLDDVIVAADEESLFGWYSLARHLADGSTHLVVRRSGVLRDVTLQATR